MRVKARPLQRQRRLGRFGLAVLFFSVVVFASTYNWLYQIGALHATSPIWAVESVLLNMGFQSGRQVKEIGVKRALKTILAAPLTVAKAYMTDSEEIPTLFLDIKFKHLNKVRALRADALDHRFIYKHHKAWIPATISDGTVVHKAKVRLKGEQIDHLQHAHKWGIRVHVKKGGHVLGMRRFSLQHPKARGYHGEPLFLESLRADGILAPRYQWVRVVLNGDDVGVMALEESFAKELLEHQSRKESVILSVDEQLRHEGVRTKTTSAISNHNAHRGIKAFGLKAPLPGTNLGLWKDYTTAVGLLRAFIEGTMPAADVFDLRKTARYLAYIEVFALKHPTETHNNRFYYNPYTARLEPIGFDGNFHQPIWHNGAEELSIAHAPDGVLAGFLRDKDGRAAFVTAYDELTRPDSLARIRSRLSARQERDLTILQREFPCLLPIDLDKRFKRAVANRSRLLDGGPLPIGAPPPAAAAPETAPPQAFGDVARAYRYSIDGGQERTFTVELRNVTLFDVDVTSFEATSEHGSPVPITMTSPLPLRLPKAAPAQASLVVLTQLKFSVEDPIPVSIVAHARLSAVDRDYEVPVLPYAPPAMTSPLKPALMDAVAAAHSGIEALDTSLRLSGTIELNEMIIVPVGVDVHIAPGTVINAGHDGGIIVLSGELKIAGTADSPVIMGPRDTSDTWRGIVTLSGDVDVAGLTVARTRGMDLPRYTTTGGVLFHEGTVKVTNSHFLDHQGEDALNIVRSAFVLDNVVISGAISDGFDCDFCTGTIKGGIWRDIGAVGGGDGIDVSGSTIEIVGTQLTNIDDKALSAGEQSAMTVHGVSVDGAGAGAVAKDGSRITGDGIKIQNARAGFMAYIKKDEYGVADIALDKAVLSKVTAPSVVQDGSSVIIDGEKQPTTALDVEALYATVMKKGAQ